MSAPLDWGLGHYEDIARELLPAAVAVVAAADVEAGERVVDVGCGTGNASLLAARAGAQVVGVDPAARLLDVARKQAVAAGLAAHFALGDAAALPLEDASVDAALSVFGVIFAPDPVVAAAELARVLEPAGRIVLSAWLPDGTMIRVTSLVADTVRTALGAPAGPAPFAWHDQAALADLFGPYGFRVSVTAHRLEYTDSSPQAFLVRMGRAHPLAVAGNAVLDRVGEREASDARVLDLLEDINEDAAAFRVSAEYVIASMRHE
jgi:ubiquinone/menaquinone biosynthesis C-methylase UbiE